MIRILWYYKRTIRLIRGTYTHDFIVVSLLSDFSPRTARRLYRLGSGLPTLHVVTRDAPRAKSYSQKTCVRDAIWRMQVDIYENNRKPHLDVFLVHGTVDTDWRIAVKPRVETRHRCPPRCPTRRVRGVLDT